MIASDWCAQRTAVLAQLWSHNGGFAQYQGQQHIGWLHVGPAAAANRMFKNTFQVTSTPFIRAAAEMIHPIANRWHD